MASSSPLASSAWLQLAGPVPEYVAPVGCVATLLTFVVLGTFRKRLRIMAPCSRCALAAEVDLGAAETAPLCEQCHNLFSEDITAVRATRPAGRPGGRTAQSPLSPRSGR